MLMIKKVKMSLKRSERIILDDWRLGTEELCLTVPSLLTLVSTKPVANAKYGLNVPGLGRIGFDFGAQIADMDVDCFFGAFQGDALQLFHQIQPGEGAAGLGHEDSQQIEFGWGEGNFLPGDGDATAVYIQHHISHLQQYLQAYRCGPSRRNTARTRASSSRIPNGLVM